MYKADSTARKSTGGKAPRKQLTKIKFLCSWSVVLLLSVLSIHLGELSGRKMIAAMLTPTRVTPRMDNEEFLFWRVVRNKNTKYI